MYASAVAETVGTCGTLIPNIPSKLTNIVYSDSRSEILVGYENGDLAIFDSMLGQLYQTNISPIVPRVLSRNDNTGSFLMAEKNEAGSTLILRDDRTGAALATRQISGMISSVIFHSNSDDFYVLSSLMGSGVWRGATLSVVGGRDLSQKWTVDVAGYDSRATNMLMDDTLGIVLVTTAGKYAWRDNILRSFELTTGRPLRVFHFQSTEGTVPAHIGVDRASERAVVAFRPFGVRVVDLVSDTSGPVPYDRRVIPGVEPLWLGGVRDGALYGVARSGEDRNSLSIVSFDLAGLNVNTLGSIDSGYSLFAMSDSGKNLYAANAETGVLKRICLG